MVERDSLLESLVQNLCHRAVAEYAHEVVFERYHEFRHAPVALARAAPAQLPVDSARFVPLRSENVQPADIISGSAHLKGTYLIPNPDNTATTGFSMQLTSGEGSARTIALRDKIPVERNKATLIRIYVLGENVFTTGVDFEVEVDTVWDGSNFVDGEID